MNKKMLLAVALICVLSMAFTINRRYSDNEDDISKKIFQNGDSVGYAAKVDSDGFYIYSGGKWKKEFIKGVNMGAAKPGYFPGEFGITKEDYMRWFEYIGQMNANTVRVYTILKPDFYEALYDYNQKAENPLYLMQGVWVNEEDIAIYNDAYHPDIVDNFKKDIEAAVDVLHGNKVLKKTPGHAYGIYEKDVSPYVLGFILGIEWDPEFVENTDSVNQNNEDYEGEYLYSQGASAFENFLCEIGDHAIAYQTENYTMQSPVSFSNWVTTDMLSHPNEPDKNEDMATVNVEHIKAKESFKAGQFASYHIYPYYPDFMNYQREYVGFKDGEGNTNTYRAYLRDLKKEHTMPVLVAEFGVPSSRGKAHENIHTGFNQGAVSEKEQGEMDAAMLKDIYEEGYAGGLIFSFQDEWFKRTWNTMDFDLPDRRPYWNNMQTNEQHFGVLAFDPGEKKSICYVDADIGEWSGSKALCRDGDLELHVKSDEAYAYFMVKGDGFDFEKDQLIIPIDIMPGQGNSSYGKAGVEFEREADFAIIIDGKENSRILVDPYYDSFQHIYGERLGIIQLSKEYNKKNSGKFEPMYLCLSNELYLPQDKSVVPFSKYETGRLFYGDGNPESDSYNSLSENIRQKGDYMMMSRRFKILALTGGIILLIVALPFAIWHSAPSKELDVIIIDKTVPSSTYREHRGFMWILNNLKIKNANTQNSFRYDSDYFGYFPGKEGNNIIRELPSDIGKPDIIYIADTYGVYTDDLHDGKAAGERSELIYGGTDISEVKSIKGALGGNTIVAEFNVLASPTDSDTREALESVFGVHWKHWMGRYFSDLSADNDEIPGWMKENYAMQYGEKWNFKGAGIVMVDSRDAIIVLRKGVELAIQRQTYMDREEFGF